MYLGTELSIATLYELHKVWAATNSYKIVSKDYYFRVFGTERNLGFSVPSTDTCKTCEELSIQLKDAKEDEVKAQLQRQLDGHQTVSKTAFTALANLTADAKTKKTIKVI